jgi:hypothetical protein
MKGGGHGSCTIPAFIFTEWGTYETPQSRYPVNWTIFEMGNSQEQIYSVGKLMGMYDINLKMCCSSWLHTTECGTVSTIAIRYLRIYWVYEFLMEAAVFIQPRNHRSAWHFFFYPVPFFHNSLLSLPRSFLSFTFFLASFPYFEKIKGLWDHFPVKVCVCVYVSACVSPLLTFEWLNKYLWNLVCISWHLTPSQRRNS